MRMPFGAYGPGGKHGGEEGREIKDCPMGYLRWFVKTITVEPRPEDVADKTADEIAQMRVERREALAEAEFVLAEHEEEKGHE